MFRSLLVILVFHWSSPVYGAGATDLQLFRGNLVGIGFVQRTVDPDKVTVVLQFLVREGYATNFGLERDRISFFSADLDVEFPLVDLSPDVYSDLLRSSLPEGVQFGTDCLVVAQWQLARRHVQDLIPYSESAHRAYLTRHFEYLLGFAQWRLDVKVRWLDTGPKAHSASIINIEQRLDALPEDDGIERVELLQLARERRAVFDKRLLFHEKTLAGQKEQLVYLRAFAPTPEARDQIDRLLDAVARTSAAVSALRDPEP